MKEFAVSDPVAVRVLSVVLCAAAALIAGLIAGILTAAGGARPARAALAGGAAAVAVMPIALSVAATLRAV